MRKPESSLAKRLAVGYFVCLGWVVQAESPVRVVSEGLPGFVPVLSASGELVGARLLRPGLAEGRFARVQTRVAMPTVSPETEGRGAVRWRVATHSTYEVDCEMNPPAVERTEHLPMAWVAGVHPGKKGEVAGAVSAPPEAGVAAAFACLAARPGYSATEAAKVVQQTGGLKGLELLDCELTRRDTGPRMQLTLTLSDDPPAVRLGEKWLSTGIITSAFVAVEDAGLEIRLVRDSGALRVVSRAEMSSVASGRCVSLSPNLIKKESGW